VSTKPKLLIFELWGIGDLVLATTLIDKAGGDYQIHLLAKPFASELLAPTYPDVIFHAYQAPWTAHYGKYRLWRWHWPELLRLIFNLRREKFDAAVSVRPDPRDHFLMWLIGAKKRVGLPTKGSGVFLTVRLREPSQKWHRIEAHRLIGSSLGVQGIEDAVPKLEHTKYVTSRTKDLLRGIADPILCLHIGAGQPVRRWPEHYFAEILLRLRARYQFHLVLVRDDDESAEHLFPLADTVMNRLPVQDLVGVISQSVLLLCNDSGPMHVAIASACPTIAFFGPGDPRWFRPWGAIHHMVIRDICPYRPCFDFCKFPEPYCLTKLLPNEAWPEIEQHIDRLLYEMILPPRLARSKGLR
jgi:ADP-heptose:LPS heptosyltransferase